VREVREETGLEVEIIKILGVVDKIIKEREKIRFHFVIVDYLAHLKGGILRASSDALEAIWVKSEDFTRYELSPTLIRLLKQINLYPDD
jgi:8-oxo-dGTP diphosphatase